MRRRESSSRRGKSGLLLVFALGIAALALVAAGCGGGDDNASGTDTTAASGSCDGSIWVLLPDSTTSPRWETDDRKYFDESFKAAGIKYNIVNAEADTSTQQSQMEEAIADGAKVVVLTSIDTASGGALIDQAKEAGVDVIEYDRFNTGSSGGAAYVSFDNVAVGEKMAETLEPLIDGLDVDTPQVVQLNGSETDNNAFLFKDGYAATTKKRVDDGSWALVADQFVPNWGNSGEGQTIMEQILTDASNKVDAVFAANDNLAQQAINALDAAGVGSVPMSGQDASAAGIQNILLGKQSMTVYKPIKAEADIAAAAALALCAGEDPATITSDFEFTTIGITAEDGKPAEAGTGVPYLALTPTSVTVDNIADTVIADGFRTVKEVCTGDTADTDFCKENS